MKAALSLENQTIIPNIKFTTPNPGSMLRIRVKVNNRERLTIQSPVEERQFDGPRGTYSMACKPPAANQHKLVWYRWLKRTREIFLLQAK